MRNPEGAKQALWAWDYDTRADARGGGAVSETFWFAVMLALTWIHGAAGGAWFATRLCVRGLDRLLAKIRADARAKGERS